MLKLSQMEKYDTKRECYIIWMHGAKWLVMMKMINERFHIYQGALDLVDNYIMNFGASIREGWCLFWVNDYLFLTVSRYTY